MGPLKDELISPAYDLSALSTATLNFRLHFARQTVNDYDKLEIYTSTNCGLSWSLKYTKLASSTLPTTTSFFTTSHIPPVGSTTEWRQETISMPTNTWGSNPVRFKFKFTSAGGNNIFIDDINIFGTTATGISEIQNGNSVSVYPNPAKEILNIELGTLNLEKVQIRMLNTLGQVLLTEKPITHNSTFNIQHFPSGLYFVQISAEGFTSTKKIVISK
jgi:hypothetical protein